MNNTKNTKEKLTKSQRDTIIRKGKQLGIKVRKYQHLSNVLVFKVDGEKIPVYSIGLCVPTSYITGEIRVDPFYYDIYTDGYVLNNKNQLEELSKKLINVYNFLEWLENYLSTKI